MSQAQALRLLKDGIAAARLGDKPRTRKLLRQVVELDANNEIAWLWLAGVAESPFDALDCLQRVLTINPANERAQTGIKSIRLQAGILLAKQGDKEQAKHLLRHVVDADPNNELALLWMAGVVQDPLEAISYLERVLRINPHNENARQGILYYRSQAAPAFKCLLCTHVDTEKYEKCPKCKAFLTLNNLDVFLKNSDLDETKVLQTIDELEQHLNEEMGDFSTHYRLGMAFLNLRQLDDAIRYFQAALAFQPSDRLFKAQLNLLIHRKPAMEAQLVEQAEKERLASMRTILVVDDSPTIRKLVTMTMERAGYRVVTAQGGAEALEAIRHQGVPDLVLLDINMPGMDGYQLCKLMRQNRETAQLPIVMLSGKDGFFNKIRGRMAGSTEYITKPFQPDALVKVVAKYCPIKAGRAAGAPVGATA